MTDLSTTDDDVRVMPITWTMLVEHSACSNQMILFRRLFGTSWVPNEADARQHGHLFDIEWAADHLLDDSFGFMADMDELDQIYLQEIVDNRAYAQALDEIADKDMVALLLIDWNAASCKAHSIRIAVLFVRHWRAQFVPVPSKVTPG